MTFNRLISLCFVAVLLGESSARVYETRDAIVVEADRFDADRAGRSLSEENDIENNGRANEELDYAFPEPLSVMRTMFPSGTFYIGERTCWTPEGKFGTCASFRSCYPAEKLPTEEDDLVAWVSTRGTCQYVDDDGKQAYGVCCARNDAEQPSLGVPPLPFMMPISLSPYWWPSQFYPFAPSPVSFPYPVGQQPPSASAPSPPWWVSAPAPVNQPQQPTTSKPSTTSSPWWTPETTTAKPSTTTSPWWVAETTTTKRSTTTSPWWTPEPSTSSTPWWTTNQPPVAQTKPSTTTTQASTTKQTTAKPVTTTTTQASTTKQTTAEPVTTTTKPTTTTPKPSTLAPVTQQVVSSEKIPCGAGPYKTLSIDEQRRIVGGTNAPKNAWPFIVALFNGGRHFCGGSLIDEDHVLTAAHCVAHMSSSDVARLTIAIGMHTLKPADPEAVRVRVKRIVRHKGFDSRTLYNDVAIIQLETPAKFGSTVSAVCLPQVGSNEKYVDRSAAVVGWGALREGGPQPSVLQQVTVQVQSNDECKRRYGKDAPGGIVDHMLCAAYPGKDSCSGDSGGPLIVQQAPGAPWIQAGIVSWGIGCGKPPYPGVYSRVSSFLDWIQRNRA